VCHHSGSMQVLMRMAQEVDELKQVIIGMQVSRLF
jgi:hypothetical protein